MRYELLIERPAQCGLAKIPPPYQRNKRSWKRSPPTGRKKLSGRSAWRIRIGNYRVIYEIDDVRLKIPVIMVGHRREVYRY